MDSAGAYAESADSSPRSRGAESWDEPAAPAAPRLRLMCSHGGRIVPRPADKSLCYAGGETRMVVVDRHCSLADLASKLSRTFTSTTPFTLKYQLPNEDLDSLISLTTDEDLDNMIDEYDRLAAGAAGSNRSSRIRLFLFPSKAESAPPSAIGSLLDDSKTETWFVDALNSAMMDGIPRGLSADATSVNCLLGLEDDGVSVGSRGAQAPPEVEPGVFPRPELVAKFGRQDVQSVPDSPLLDNASSFGSASSAPSLSNLPPIRVRNEDQRLDEHLGGLSVSGGPQYQVSGQIGAQAQPAQTMTNDEDKKGAAQPKEAPIGDAVARTMYANPNSEHKRESPMSADPRVSMPVDSYVLPAMAAEPQQLQPQPMPHVLQQPQQQYIPANAHYIHHPATGAVVPIAPYFHPMAAHPIQQSQQTHLAYDPQLQMYYLPVRSPAPYNLASAVPDPTSLLPGAKQGVSMPRPAAKPEMQQQPASIYRTSAPAPAPPTVIQPQLIRVGAAAPDQAHSYNGLGYQYVQQQQHFSQSPANMANFGYEYTTDPAHAQMYYSQATTSPALATTVQYQAVNSGAVNADVSTTGEMKVART